MTVDLRVAHASAVIVQHVPAASKEQFLTWQHKIARVAERFAGYAGTDVYPPSCASRDQWVIVQHFDDEESLQTWLSSPVREHCVADIQADLGQATLTRLHGGFADWFTSEVQAENRPVPADWKMALAVLLGLYPIVMLLTLYFPGPYTKSWGLAVAMLLSNALSVSILQWVVMPFLNKLLGPWLLADRRREARLFYGGLVGIIAALVVICAAFRAVSS